MIRLAFAALALYAVGQAFRAAAMCAAGMTVGWLGVAGVAAMAAMGRRA